MKSVILATLLSLCCLSAQANEFETVSDVEEFNFISLGLIDSDMQVLPQGTVAHSDWSLDVGMGKGWRYRLNSDWLLENRVSVHYSQQNLVSELADGHWGQVDNYGLWASSRLANTSLFDNVSPFVELGAGVVYADYQSGQQSGNDWSKGYRAVAGLSFELGNDASISVGVGTSDQEDIGGF